MRTSGQKGPHSHDDLDISGPVHLHVRRQGAISRSQRGRGGRGADDARSRIHRRHGSSRAGWRSSIGIEKGDVAVVVSAGLVVATQINYAESSQCLADIVDNVAEPLSMECAVHLSNLSSSCVAHVGSDNNMLTLVATGTQGQ